MNDQGKALSNRIFLLFLLALLNFSSYGQSVRKELISQFKKDQKSYLEYEKQHGHFVQTDHVLMHYLTWGNPKSTPIIWIHGSLLNAYEMAPVAKWLTSAGYYLIAIDYYGHGKTPMPKKEVSLYHIADDIVVLMDSLKLEKAVIGGFSRGGYIASATYQTYPNRVKALILEDGGSVSFNTFYHKMSENELDEKAKSMNLSPEIKKRYASSYQTAFAAYESLYDQQVGGDQFEILALIKQIGDQWITYQGLMEYFSMADEHEFKNLVLHPDILPLFASSITYIQPKIIFRNVKVPVLIMDPVSANDPMPFAKENIQLAADHPNFITRKAYQGVEHNIHYAKPKQFAVDVIAFLDQLKQE